MVPSTLQVLESKLKTSRSNVRNACIVRIVGAKVENVGDFILGPKEDIDRLRISYTISTDVLQWLTYREQVRGT